MSGSNLNSPRSNEPHSFEEAGGHAVKVHSEPDWRLLQTKSRSERISASALRDHGFEVYLPILEVAVDDTERKSTPLFPGYLFVRASADMRSWSDVATFPGVLGWVKFDGEIPKVAHKVIQMVSLKLEELNSQGGAWRSYDQGEVVRVEIGKIDSLAEVLESPKSPAARVKVLLEFMGRQVTTTVPWQSLKPTTVQDVQPRRRRRTRGKGRWIKGETPRIAHQP